VARRLGPALPLEDLTEKEWMAQGVSLARTMGWKRYHTYRSDRSEPGWPDDALVRDRLILIEWKTEKGKLSDAQKEWIRALLNAQVEVYVCRPRHLEELALVLHARGRMLQTAMLHETYALCGLD
jgi:hypothetical protein